MNKKHQDLYRLANILKIPKPDIFSQDWEYELNIDFYKINELFEIYQNTELNTHQKQIFMKIMIELLNDNINNKEPHLSDPLNLILEKIICILKIDFNIHRETVYRYADLGNSIEDCFPISPVFRHFLENNKQLLQPAIHLE